MWILKPVFTKDSLDVFSPALSPWLPQYSIFYFFLNYLKNSGHSFTLNCCCILFQEEPCNYSLHLWYVWQFLKDSLTNTTSTSNLLWLSDKNWFIPRTQLPPTILHKRSYEHRTNINGPESVVRLHLKGTNHSFKKQTDLYHHRRERTVEGTSETCYFYKKKKTKKRYIF